MPRTGKRTTLARGIYADSGGLEVRVTVGGITYSERYPLGTSLDDLKKAWRKLRSLGDTETPRAERGSLIADAKRYLDLIRHLSTAGDRDAHLRAWIALYGNDARTSLTAADVLKARALWLTQGLAPKTINHRCDTLRNLFHRLDGQRAPTPCDDVPHLHVPRSPIHRVPEALMIAIDQELQRRERAGILRDAKTRARYRVLVSTGKRPCEVMRAQPGDVNLTARVWVPRDAKGGFTAGVYLNDDQRAAWQLFIEANAWGQFFHGGFVRVLRSAGWPAGVRFYQARHNTWIAASERGVDLHDIAAGAGHTDPRMTRKMYVPVLNSRLQQMSETLDGRFEGWKSVAPESGSGRKRQRTKAL
jgi:integrase